MRKVYPIGEDIFIASAFVSFLVAMVVKVVDLTPLPLGVTPSHIFSFSLICLLFSIALSLRDMAQQK
ncbi:MAG: hypothetical protein PHJ00_01775 [Candidatus Omnitrophica bacterium]|nr:hypothetical protein [Candidatus Omnitrophota bacterium]MDD5655316.1 hypothetical protein [Candidatus Omnitrophota bacterium]